MQMQSTREDYRCLIDILTCLVCKELVEHAHICPNCSKFYCYGCISQQLGIEETCLNCSQPLQHNMLVNCQQLCNELKQTLQMARLRGQASPKMEKSELYCATHQLNKTYYCRTCQTPLCSDCSVLTRQHRGHDFIKLTIVREEYNKRTNEIKQQLKNTKGTLLKKIEAAQRGVVKSGSGGNESVADLEYANKALRQELRRRASSLLESGQKDLNQLTCVQDQWAKTYDESMQMIKLCSKGKFVSTCHSQLEKGLTSVLDSFPREKAALEEVKRRVFKQKKYDSFVTPSLISYTFILDRYSVMKEEESFYTSSIVTPEGLEWRLKVYPQGVESSEQTNLKLTKKHSKNEEYLAIFIELVSGPAPTLQKHQIIVVNQLSEGKSVVREFESEFERGECWGYETFMRVSQLTQEGFYNEQEDYVEVILRLAPSTYYQACSDQVSLLQQKQAQLSQKKVMTPKWGWMMSTAGSFGSSNSIESHSN